MIVMESQQGSKEWLEERMGLPTASNFNKIVTSKGNVSESRKKYMYGLAAERVSRVIPDSYKSADMDRGNELEEEARREYRRVSGNKVVECGFCLSDSSLYGASPDGLVESNGLLEIKCPRPSTHVEYVIKDQLPTAYFQQTQGQLLVTGREWCDFVSYCPGLEPFIVRVVRDNEFINKLERELTIFCKELEGVCSKLKPTEGLVQPKGESNGENTF